MPFPSHIPILRVRLNAFLVPISAHVTIHIPETSYAKTLTNARSRCSMVLGRSINVAQIPFDPFGTIIPFCTNAA